MTPQNNERVHTGTVLATRWAGKTVCVTTHDGNYEGMIVDVDGVGIFLETVTTEGRSREMSIPHKAIRIMTLMP